MTSGLRHPAIDLLKLYAHWTSHDWNTMLTKCAKEKDIRKLAATLYGLQAGMAILGKQKLNTAEMDRWYLRLTKSIELAAKYILRTLYLKPKPDDPEAFFKWHKIKKQRDAEFQKFLKEASY